MVKGVVGEALEINRVLWAHGCGAGVVVGSGIVVTPSFVLFRVARMGGVRVRDVVGLLPEISEALTELRGERVVVRVDTNPLVIEVPRVDRRVLAYGGGVLSSLSSGSFLCGRSYLGGVPREHVLDLSSPHYCHIFVAGQTGSGKTTLLRVLLLSLCYGMSPELLQVYLVDLKNSGLVPLREMPHVRAFAGDEYEAAQVIRMVFAEMVRRNHENAGVEPRIVLVVDDLRELRFGDDRMLDDWCSRIVSLGRERGVHVVAATQKPLSSELGPIVNSQFPVRLVGVVADSREAALATRRPGTHAELLPGDGSFLLLQHEGHPVRIQSYWMEDVEGEVARVCKRWSGVDVGERVILERRVGMEAYIRGLVEDGPDAELLDAVEKARGVVESFRGEGGVLRRGVKSAVVRAVYGEGTNPGGVYYEMANRVIDYLGGE